MQYTNVIERVPTGSLGNVEIVHSTPSPFERMRAAMGRQPLNREKYARLLVGGCTMMTDAEFERITNAEFIREAKGDVLIAGLGLGLILDPVIERCSSVTVIEVSPHVISLVAPSFPRANVIEADIRNWTPGPGVAFDTIYFDIWPHFNGDTSKDAASLQRRFRKYLRDGGWMKSWCVIANRAKR